MQSMKNRLEETNGKHAEAKAAETPKPVETPTASTEKRRDATDLDEVSIRLWNAYNDLAAREDEFVSVLTALVNERKKHYANSQMDLRSRFGMPPSPKIEVRPDGTRELVWTETPEKGS
jgi:hypothetical protein